MRFFNFAVLLSSSRGSFRTSKLKLDVVFQWMYVLIHPFQSWWDSPFGVQVLCFNLQEGSGSQLQSLEKFYQVVFGCKLISFNVRRPTVCKGSCQSGQYPH